MYVGHVIGVGLGVRANFVDKILLRRVECRDPENLNKVFKLIKMCFGK